MIIFSNLNIKSFKNLLLMFENHMKKSVLALQEYNNTPSFESFYLWWTFQEQKDKNYTFNFNKYDEIKSGFYYYYYYYYYNGKEE